MIVCLVVLYSVLVIFKKTIRIEGEPAANYLNVLEDSVKKSLDVIFKSVPILFFLIINILSYYLIEGCAEYGQSDRTIHGDQKNTGNLFSCLFKSRASTQLEFFQQFIFVIDSKNKEI